MVSLEFTSMKIKKFMIDEYGLNYSVGINQINIDINAIMKKYGLKQEEDVIDTIFSLIENLENKYNRTMVQFFSDKYIVSEDHVYNACYFVQKAFKANMNISNKKHIEFLLYLSANRQIKIGIENFGIKFNEIKKGRLNYCIISSEKNIIQIDQEIINQLLANIVNFNLNEGNADKCQDIKILFGFSDKQISVILKSYSLQNSNNSLLWNNLAYIKIALNDLICEQMALLTLEKVKVE
jgi:tRNA threonylcarbamoyladenosine modification (KEOPS) complex Cgi121 subunit